MRNVNDKDNINTQDEIDLIIEMVKQREKDNTKRRNPKYNKNIVKVGFITEDKIDLDINEFLKRNIIIRFSYRVEAEEFNKFIDNYNKSTSNRVSIRYSSQKLPYGNNYHIFFARFSENRRNGNIDLTYFPNSTKYGTKLTNVIDYKNIVLK